MLWATHFNLVLSLLAIYGRIRALAFGAFGEASDDVHTLVDTRAGGRASRDWARMRCQDQNEAKAVLAHTLYRSWGFPATLRCRRLRRHRNVAVTLYLDKKMEKMKSITK